MSRNRLWWHGGERMIFDTRQRIAHHLPQPVREAIAAYLDDPTLGSRPAGTQDLGRGIRALLQEYQTRPRGEGRWEAHRAFWDLQLVLRGAELLGWAPLEALRPTGPFDEAGDVGFFEGDGDFLALRAGRFALLAPTDAHMPCIASGTPAAVRKVVFKIPAALMG